MTPSVEKVQCFASYVEYRSLSGPGVRVVRVFTNLKTPRISAICEDHRGEFSFEPLTLFLNEIEDFVNDALERQG